MVKDNGSHLARFFGQCKYDFLWFSMVKDCEFWWWIMVNKLVAAMIWGKKHHQGVSQKVCHFFGSPSVSSLDNQWQPWPQDYVSASRSRSCLKSASACSNSMPLTPHLTLRSPNVGKCRISPWRIQMFKTWGLRWIGKLNINGRIWKYGGH